MCTIICILTILTKVGENECESCEDWGVELLCQRKGIEDKDFGFVPALSFALRLNQVHRRKQIQPSMFPTKDL